MMIIFSGFIILCFSKYNKAWWELGIKGHFSHQTIYKVSIWLKNNKQSHIGQWTNKMVHFGQLTTGKYQTTLPKIKNISENIRGAHTLSSSQSTLHLLSLSHHFAAVSPSTNLSILILPNPLSLSQQKFYPFTQCKTHVCDCITFVCVYVYVKKVCC